MKKIYAFLFVAFASQIGIAQIIDGHAYMQGDYVEIGINTNGQEGAPCQPGYHCRGGSGDLFGFVSNPAMDGWVDFNGDFFTPGSPECGFGLTYTVLGTTYHRSNNYDGAAIDGEVTDYTETADSIIVTWVGDVDDLELTIVYELKKDEHYYTTSISIENLGLETYTDVYYYRNIDPDNNQSIGGSYTTENTIVSQSGMADDSCIVVARQDFPWDSEVAFIAYGPEWKCFSGGFSNRNGSEMWNGSGLLSVTEGFESSSDQAMGVAHKDATILPGKRAASETFFFATVFKAGAYQPVSGGDASGINEDGIAELRLYPNPTNNALVTINLEGNYAYQLIDIKGSVLKANVGNNITQVNLDGIAKGTYFLKVTMDSKTQVEKLVVE